MTDKVRYDAASITVLTGLEAVRRRPAMYIGGEDVHPNPSVRLLEATVKGIIDERPQEVRILLWREGAVTIAYDGEPLPIEPFSLPTDGVPHPALYRSFLSMPMGPLYFCAVLNALSERLVVSTMHAGKCYRVVFAKGGIVSLLRRTYCKRPLGTTWLTYLCDMTMLPGDALTPEDVRGVIERIERDSEGVAIRFEDRMTEDADMD